MDVDVVLVDLGGELGDLDLERLASRLNALRTQSFRFEVGEPVAVESLGRPTIRDEWYDRDVLLDALRSRRRSGGRAIVVGVTHLKMSRSDVAEDRERSFFTVGDGGGTSVVSVHRDVVRHAAVNRSEEQYVVFCLLAELLSYVADGRIAYHAGRPSCVFEVCEDRADFALGMERARVCGACLAKLDPSGRDDALRRDVESLLGWVRREPWSTSIDLATRDRFVSLAFGAALGWLVADLFSSGQSEVVVLLAFAVFGVVLFRRRRAGAG